MNHEAMRAQQVAEVTIRDKFLELAKHYEERGMACLMAIGNRDPVFAYEYKALCDRQAARYRKLVKETFL